MTGRLLVFNPGHEEALRLPQGQSYTPPKEVQRMMLDLSPLMRLVACTGDYIWLPRAEGVAQIATHEGVLIEDLSVLPPLLLTPWALEPRLIEQITRQATSLGIRLISPEISSAYLSLSHRRSASDLLEHLSEHWTEARELTPRWIMPTDETERELRELLEDFRLSRGLREVIVKRPYTSSGRGVMAYDLPLSDEKIANLVAACSRSGGLSVEPRLNLVQDWAAEYDYAEGKARYIGLSKFTTTATTGAYTGNELRSEQALWAELSAVVGEESLQALVRMHQDFLTARLGRSYEGYIGIDMFVYLDESGAPKLHPAVEINVRCTMGVLALMAYERHLAPNNIGTYQLIYGKPPTMHQLYQKHLVQSEAFVPLTHPSEQSAFYAYITKQYSNLSGCL
ncbi:MAG: hypothetical protein Q4A64_04650 [Porphyromonadaceae bacterium]|nr:hypothetical protein [Porphyromonadaceae bacterium]